MFHTTEAMMFGQGNLRKRTPNDSNRFGGSIPTAVLYVRHTPGLHVTITSDLPVLLLQRKGAVGHIVTVGGHPGNFQAD